jgi:protein-L-isoaspartate(D-aspartate) O-methyltransferase
MAMKSTNPFESDRRAMIDRQLRRRGIREPRVLEAMDAVPRHEFVPAEFLPEAYEDRPLPIGESETISQPYMVAAMTAAARIDPGHRVLEVGTGSGYQAAILAHLGARVVTIERNSRLSEEARARLARLGLKDVVVITGDGTRGYPPGAPYNAIVVTAGAPGPPQALLDQLADGGRLVIPIGGLRQQILQVIFKHEGQYAVRDLDPCQFVPLVGEHGWPLKEGG